MFGMDNMFGGDMFSNDMSGDTSLHVMAKYSLVVGSAPNVHGSATAPRRLPQINFSSKIVRNRKIALLSAPCLTAKGNLTGSEDLQGNIVSELGDYRPSGRTS
jgi:hypothetical protein